MLEKAKQRQRRDQHRERLQPTAESAAQPSPLQLYRTGRLAQLFDVHRSTIFRWRESGKLPPFVNIGGVEGLTGDQMQRLYRQLEGDAGDE